MTMDMHDDAETPAVRANKGYEARLALELINCSQDLVAVAWSHTMIGRTYTSLLCYVRIFSNMQNNNKPVSIIYCGIQCAILKQQQ